MRPKVLTGVTVMAAISILAISAQLTEAQQEQKQPRKYYVFNLGDPGGANSAAAASINNLGWIAGNALQSGNANEHAELWVGTPIDLERLAGRIVRWLGQTRTAMGRLRVLPKAPI